MAYDISKPSVKDDKWLVFPDTTFYDINTFDCENCVEGVCYKNKSIDQCIEICDKNSKCSFGHYISLEGSDGKKSWCMPIRDLKVQSSPIYRLRNKSYYPELKNTESSVFVNKNKFSFPPNFSDFVHYMDNFNLYNIETTLLLKDTKDTKEDDIIFSDKDELIMQLFQYPPNLGVGPNYIHILYGDNIVFNIPTTTLVMRIQSDDSMKWEPRVPTLKNQSFFQIYPTMPGKKIGDPITYHDTFSLVYNVYTLGINTYNKLQLYYMDYKKANELGLNVTFKFIPQMIGWYCDKNKCSQVSIKDIDKDGTYKGVIVSRIPECYGTCNYNMNNLSSFSYIKKGSNSFLILFIIIMSIFILFIIYHFYNFYHKRYTRINT